MAHADLDIVGPLIVEYYNWVSGNGGTHPESLLKRPLTESQAALLRQRMEDVDVVYLLTAPLRDALRTDPEEAITANEDIGSAEYYLN